MNSDVTTCFNFPSTIWISPNISITAKPDHEGREEIFPGFRLRVLRIFPSTLMFARAFCKGHLERSGWCLLHPGPWCWACGSSTQRWGRGGGPLKNPTLEMCQRIAFATVQATSQHATAPYFFKSNHTKSKFQACGNLPSCMFQNINRQYPGGE